MYLIIFFFQIEGLKKITFVYFYIQPMKILELNYVFLA